MATKLADDPVLDVAFATDPPPPPKKRSRLFIALLLGGVMLAEGVVLYLVLPRSEQASTAGAAEAAPADAPTADAVEVSVGQFQCTNSVAARGSTIFLTFDVAATVARKQSEAFSLAVSSHHKARVRQAIIQVARSSSMEDLKDPEFSVLKRQIKEEINKVLRKSYVDEIVISDIRMIEQ